MISSSIPFPPISWWIMACKENSVTFDLAEHYQKMSYRNRYYLASPQGSTLMSIPLQKGRNQRIPVSEVRVDNSTNWQQNHWRTIVSLYRRSPFFDYFDHVLSPLYQDKYELLSDWNMASIKAISEILGIDLNIETCHEYHASYAGEMDLRGSFLPQKPAPVTSPVYYQVFEDRTGFIPDCSILDLICCEGKHALELIK